MADILNVEQHQTIEEFKQNLEELLPDVRKHSDLSRYIDILPIYYYQLDIGRRYYSLHSTHVIWKVFALVVAPIRGVVVVVAPCRHTLWFLIDNTDMHKQAKGATVNTCDKVQAREIRTQSTNQKTPPSTKNV